MDRAARLRRDRRERRDLSAFRFLLAEPADMGDGSDEVTLPGRARLAVSHEEALEAGDVTVSVGGQEFSVPDLAADVVHRGIWGERGMAVTVASDGAPAGTLTLYIVDPFGRHLPIATAELA